MSDVHLQGSAKSFLFEPPLNGKAKLKAISLFSGAGFSDYGYALAGFSFEVQAEIDPKRAALCATNFPGATSVVGDLRDTWKRVVKAYRQKCRGSLDLLVATPPCQGMSSSNPGRGKVADPDSGNLRSRERNLLVLAAAKVAAELKPRIIVIENVPQFLLRTVRLRESGRPRRVVDVFLDLLPGYKVFTGVVQMADYGIPQLRRRSVMTLIRKDEGALRVLEKHDGFPWPRTTHAESPLDGEPSWVTVETWFQEVKYPPLDARRPDTARDPRVPLHSVPVYLDHRYAWVADIPPRSGASAYQNSICHACGQRRVPVGRVRCDNCGEPMLNRPLVKKKGKIRLVKGFLSSYRRMKPNRPAPTITTATSHLGSDYKIHPWENRVLSILECADLQTIPRTYNWSYALDSGLNYILRQVIGEAVPPWFTYLHGLILHDLLSERSPSIPLYKATSNERALKSK